MTNEYRELDEEEELSSVGGGSRKVITMEPDKPLTVIMRGLAVVGRVNAQSEAFDSTQIVVMLPEEFKDDDRYGDEFALSISGNAAKQAAAHFCDPDQLKSFGEVWLAKEWLNKRCKIMYTRVVRPTDEDKGYSPYTSLTVSKGRDSKRTDLPDTFAPCAGYQQQDKDEVESGGNSYSMNN